MLKFRCPAAILLVATAAFGFQTVEPSKSPYERRGLYHATVRGRILSHTGEAVAGVHVQLNAGRPRALPLVDVVTDAHGRFTMNASAFSKFATLPIVQYGARHPSKRGNRGN